MQEMPIDFKGPLYDRMWMLVDTNAQFITQRTYPELAQVQVELAYNSGVMKVFLNAPDRKTVSFEAHKLSQNMVNTAVWKSDLEACEVDPEVSRWFSDFLQTPCRLVGMAPWFKRNVNPEYDPFGKSEVSFADGYPFLLVAEESLADFNEHFGLQTMIDRFRPNIVVSGLTPFEEDFLSCIKFETLMFKQAKRCTRCIMVNVDQQTGKVDALRIAPLSYLGKYRRGPKGIYFGVNLVHQGSGSLRVGDEATYERFANHV